MGGDLRPLPQARPRAVGAGDRSRGHRRRHNALFCGPLSCSSWQAAEELVVVLDGMIVWIGGWSSWSSTQPVVPLVRRSRD